jgi:membrane-associated phospholipid phosphatase
MTILRTSGGGDDLAARPVRHIRWGPLLAQVALVFGAALAYFLVRDLTQGAIAAAEDNAERVLGAERALHIAWEGPIQGWIIDHDRLVDLANWIYIYGHWPVIGITLVILFLRVPAEYRILRNAMFISGAIGLVVFAVFPVAPPRLGILDLADTVTERSSSYRTLQPPGLINKYAAMPSLHFGWNLLVGIVIWRATSRRWLRVAAVVLPALMAVAVVATANHYVLDVLAGAAVALIGLAAALALRRAREGAAVPRAGP